MGGLKHQLKLHIEIIPIWRLDNGEDDNEFKAKGLHPYQFCHRVGVSAITSLEVMGCAINFI